MDFTLVSSVFDTLQIAPASKLVLLEAGTLAAAHVPPYPPDMPVLFTHINSRAIASHLKIVLLTTYPKTHEVFLVAGGNSMTTQLEALDVKEDSKDTCLYVPSLGRGHPLNPLQKLWLTCVLRTAVRGIGNRLMSHCASTCWKSLTRQLQPSIQVILPICGRSSATCYYRSSCMLRLPMKKVSSTSIR